MYYNTPYLSWQNGIEQYDDDDVIRNATYLNAEDPNVAFVNKFYNWTAAHVDSNGVVVAGTPQILAVDDNNLAPWRLALQIIPNNNNNLLLSITGIAIDGTTTAELDSLTYIFHALFKSSEKISVKISMEVDGYSQDITPVTTNFDVTEEYLTCRSNFAELYPNKSKPSNLYIGLDATVTINILITSHNSQTLYMTCPFLYQEYEYMQNPFVKNSIKYIPQVLFEIDQAQDPQYPMAKLIHALNHASAQTSALAARFWKLDLEELPVEYDGTEDFSKSKLVDPNLADYEYLDWLAQFNGTSVRKNIYAPNPANATKTQNLGVRVATTTAGSTPYSLATSFANGDTVDGVVLKTGDRILIKNQAFLSQNGIYVVGDAGRLSTASTTFTASGTSISGAATYTGVSQSATSGSGTGAVFTITKTGSGTTYTGFITVTITSGGANYVVGDTITIPGASLGGGGNLTLTIGGSLTGAPTRATDMPAGLLNISAGFSVWVNSGTLNSGTIWRLTNASNPTVGTDALTFAIKQISVDVATTTAGTLATSFENTDYIDNFQLSTGDKILIKNQATASQNGVYVVAASGAPTRIATLPAAYVMGGSLTPSRSISAASYNSVSAATTYTTTTAHGFSNGDIVQVTGISPTSFNTTAAAFVTNSTQFYFQTFVGNSGGSYSTGGTATTLTPNEYLDVFVADGLSNRYKIFRSTSNALVINTDSLNFSEVALSAYEDDVDAFARWQISNGYWGYKAGTREAFDGILERYLTGTKYRTYTLTGFLLSIKTLYDETPWASYGRSPLLEALLEPARPAGYKLVVEVVHDLRFTFNSATLGQFNDDPLG